MLNNKSRKFKRNQRHSRVRKKISGTPEIPRVSVFKSSRHIYAQVIDDSNGITIAQASTLTPDLKKELDNADLKKTDKANIVGKHLAEIALSKNIKKIRFDRGGYPYHGRVRSLAEGLRESGLEF